MLLALKEKVSGWVAYVVVGLITIPFAFWGIQQYFGLLGNEDVIVVGDTNIQLLEFEELVTERRRALELSGRSDVDNTELRKLVARDIIGRAVLEEVIKDAEYVVPETLLKNVIVGNKDFWRDGVFDKDWYTQVLKRSGLTPPIYESRLQRNLKSSTFVSAIRDTGFVLPNEEQQYSRLAGEKRDISYVLPVIEHFVVEDDVKESDLVTFFEDNRDRYRSPLRLKLKYVELNFDDILNEANITTKQITTYYTENEADFTISETRSVRAISVGSDEDGISSQDKAAELRRKILQSSQDAIVILEEAMEGEGSVFVDFVENLQEYDIEDDAMREDIFSLREGEVTDIRELDEETSQFFYSRASDPRADTAAR